MVAETCPIMDIACCLIDKNKETIQKSENSPSRCAGGVAEWDGMYVFSDFYVWLTILKVQQLYFAIHVGIFIYNT